MKPVPLRAPDGTVMAWACGECLRVSGGSSFITDGAYTAEQAADLAESSHRSAERCCTCLRCGEFCARLAWPSLDRPHQWCDLCWEKHGAAHRTERSARMAAFHAQGEAEERTYEAALDRDAAKQLREVMSDLSEDAYCAGWLIGLEYDLWGFLCNGLPESESWGMSEISTDDLVELRRLSEAAGGWVTFEGFVPMEQWLVIVAKREAGGGA